MSDVCEKDRRRMQNQIVLVNRCLSGGKSNKKEDTDEGRHFRHAQWITAGTVCSTVDCGNWDFLTDRRLNGDLSSHPVVITKAARCHQGASQSFGARASAGYPPRHDLRSSDQGH
jgi:hypothetical protein